MEQQIRETLEQLRVMLQGDGGDLEVIGIEGKTVTLRLTGACVGCPHAAMTIQHGVQRILREQVDEEIVVEQVD